MLTAAQIRAARALLDWTQPDLAREAGLSLPTVRRMEGAMGPGRSSAANVDAVRRALERGGVEFIGAGDTGKGAGVRFKK